MTINKGDTIFYVVLKVSRSGMSREIAFFQPLIDPDGLQWIDNISYLIADELGWTKSKKNNAIKIKGCGMDMAYHTVDSLSYKLFGQGYQLKSYCIA